jgi:hypothetical protein
LEKGYPLVGDANCILGFFVALRFSRFERESLSVFFV